MISPVLRAFLISLCTAISLRAQIVTYTWTGAAGYNYWTEPANWLGNTVPLEDVVNTRVVFGNTRSAHIDYSEIHVNQLNFQGITQPFELHGGWDTTHIGSGGIIYNPAQPVRSFIMDAVQLEASQTWDIQQGKFIVEGPISDTHYDPLANAGAGANVSGNYKITKAGTGTLVLQYRDSLNWTGGLSLTAGQVAVIPTFLYDDFNYTYYPVKTDALGSGTLTFNGGTLVAARNESYGNIDDNDQAVIVENNVVSNGLISTKNEVELRIGYSGEGSSTIELTANTTVQSSGKPLFLEGNITQTGGTGGTPRSLTVNSNGAVVLAGANSYTGGTMASNGVLIFGNDYSIPDTGAVTVAASGYAGIGSPLGQAKFFSKMTPASVLGTVGFDSDPEGSTNTFTDPINLTNFGTTARLGSATQAILGSTAVITPQGTAYRFGGGGGFLQVDSQLTDQTGPTAARSLVLDSPAAAPLTLRLKYTGNNYTGGTSVTNSALIFGSSGGTGTFPGGTRNVTINAGGYVGFEIWGAQSDANLVLNSLTKINTASVGAVGFDGNGGYYILPNTAPIDLSAFTNALYLSTSTKGVDGPGLTVSGLITPAGGATAPYRFAGYKGGALLVESTLTDVSPTVARAVHIGDPASPSTFGDYASETYSTVGLTGNNSGLTGPIMLYGGQLVVGQSNGTPGTDPTNALGSGTLEVTGMTLPAEWSGTDGEPPAPRLSTTASGLIIPNNINLSTELNVGGDNSFTLAGNISGTGELYVGEDSIGGFTLGLTGNNTFSGGVYVASGAIINAGSNTALGTGPVGFGYSGGTINFQTAAPVIGSLMTKGENDYASLNAAAPNTLLTINQILDGKFRGTFQSTDVSGALRVVKDGANTLRLDYGSLAAAHGVVNADLSGAEIGLQVNQGTLVLGSGFSIGSSTPTLWVHGGTLALAGSSDYYNPVYNPIVVDNGGRLAGNGAFASSVAIGTGAILSPGLADAGAIGMLAFDHLELNPGGVYEWQIQDANSSFGHDQIVISTPTTLVINATPANRFTLKVISLALNGTNGALTGFDPTQPYAWSIFSYDSLGGAFDPAAFTIDASLFANSLVGGPGGSGFFTLSDTGGQIMLNFTPVPEPSTYALLALGLGIIGLTAWRKRRAS